MTLTLPSPPKVGMVSLGCPKALVDSERILTKLRSDGYELSAEYEEADVVLVNTCGFLDSAKEESLAAIGEAIAENGRVIVTGCMGNEAEVSGRSFRKSSRSPGRTNMRASSGPSTSPRRCRLRPISTWCRRAGSSSRRAIIRI
jgi:tRNA A37 methylthiotransferase MiaB